MTAMCRTSVFVLAVLLAAATAAADTVIAADKAIPCSIASAGCEQESQAEPDADLPEPPPSATDGGLQCRPAVIDTLARGASPAEMVARCRKMDAVLLGCGQSNDTIVELLREVKCEEAALRTIPPRWETVLLTGGGCGGLLGMIAGGALAVALTKHAFEYTDWGWPVSFGCVGCAAGGALGFAAGVLLGANLDRPYLAGHRSRVNDLVRRVNRAIATAP